MSRGRYTVDQALADFWINDKQCKIDLAKLEQEEIVMYAPKILT